MAVEEGFMQLESSWKQVAPSWQRALNEVSQDPFGSLERFWKTETSQVSPFPQPQNIFKAFELTPLEKVKVVIMGQDPYHDDGQAHGLAFSVPPGVSLPPSLRNIFKELTSDLGCKLPASGCLEPWAKQGVLLLNVVLSVRPHQAHSHRRQGWEELTSTLLRQLCLKREGLVFLLWGKPAQDLVESIASDIQRRHFFLKSAHPSPLSAYRGFLGCRHFSKANQILIQQGREPIDWCLA